MPRMANCEGFVQKRSTSFSWYSEAKTHVASGAACRDGRYRYQSIRYSDTGPQTNTTEYFG